MAIDPRTGQFTLKKKKIKTSTPSQFVKPKVIENSTISEDKILYITSMIGSKLIEELKVFLETLPQKQVVLSQREVDPVHVIEKPSIKIDTSLIDVGINEKEITKGEQSGDISKQQASVVDSSLQESKAKLSSLKKKK